MIHDFEEKYNQYLSDESKLKGRADWMAFPQSREQIIQAIDFCRKNHVNLTVQGGNTGVVGGSVPNSGLLLNMGKMDWIVSRDQQNLTVTVMAGCSVAALNADIERNFKNCFWPVDPTEKTATVGGILSTGARGPNAYKYGSCHHYIESFTVITAGRTIHKVNKDHELFDIIIGGEGMYGIIESVRLKLILKPENIWGILFFFEETSQVIDFIRQIKSMNTRQIIMGEYLDKRSVCLINSFKDSMEKIKNLEINDQYDHLVYLEIFGETDDDTQALAVKLMEAAETCHSAIDDAVAVSTEADLEKMRHFRHAAAECCNIRIEQARSTCKQLTKLSTDISQIRDLKNFLDTDYDVEFVIFGHILSSHLHLNFLPENKQEHERAKQYIRNLTLSAHQAGSCVFTEHGAGKVKKDIYLDLNMAARDRENKNKHDPDNIFNAGNRGLGSFSKGRL